MAKNVKLLLAKISLYLVWCKFWLGSPFIWSLTVRTIYHDLISLIQEHLIHSLRLIMNQLMPQTFRSEMPIGPLTSHTCSGAGSVGVEVVPDAGTGKGPAASH